MGKVVFLNKGKHLSGFIGDNFKARTRGKYSLKGHFSIFGSSSIVIFYIGPCINGVSIKYKNEKYRSNDEREVYISNSTQEYKKDDNIQCVDPVAECILQGRPDEKKK